MELTITVNNREYTLEVDPKESLLFILRERLGLTGTKNGCSQGHCGACTIVLNGKAVKACLKKAKKINRANILTIEGISPEFPNKELHPIQEAFIQATAVQCGFCTSGLIMELFALLRENPSITEQGIKEALEGHLCRCTGYQPIFDASLLAQKMMRSKNSG
ncbi:MAG: (2Fe-2S)-binding protein [Candidatus Heimdallarchaeota archaeon]|nr:MAG: (2Fe-2S)-binding protein [Candidatus Heimdallarchaeota archaeon]